MYHDLRRPIIEGSAVAACLLIAEHIALWDVQHRLPLVARYTLGTLALLAGGSVAARRLGQREAALCMCAVAVIGGAVVSAMHLVRYAAPDTLEAALQESESNAFRLPRTRRDR